MMRQSKAGLVRPRACCESVFVLLFQLRGYVDFVLRLMASLDGLTVLCCTTQILFLSIDTNS